MKIFADIKIPALLKNNDENSEFYIIIGKYILKCGPDFVIIDCQDRIAITRIYDTIFRNGFVDNLSTLYYNDFVKGLYENNPFISPYVTVYITEMPQL